MLASDSLPNGFNYYQASSPDEAIQSLWYADEEETIYFHDHIFAIKQGVHGMFCGLIVEPEGSEWRDPYSGDPVYSGAQADIVSPEGEAFREQALHYHDFAPLREPDGDFVNPEREHIVNKGTMAINYRNAPYYNRGGGAYPGTGDDDPAYVHSSAVHGDPPTPVVEAYDGDRIRFRVFRGAYEEQHTFSVHGFRAERDPGLVEESVSKYLGTSEGFTFEVPGTETEREGYETDNPDGLPVRDFLYGSNVVDDLWAGMWGLVRLWGGEVDHLRPLGEETSPAESLSEAELRGMGHPAPYSTLGRTDEGQRAKQLYDVSDAAALRSDDPPPFDGDDPVGLPGSASRDAVESNRRRHGVCRTVVLPADVAARRNRATGEEPPTPEDAPSRHPGPEDAAVREYDVTALEVDIPYNDHGDHDPHGVVFALDRYANEVAAGERDPEPLVLRVNADERLRVNLTNHLPPDADNDHPHPEMLIQREWERSDRVSLHPLALRRDVNRSAGAAFGFNYDTTVGPDETLEYERYAEDEAVSTVCLWDMADVRSTRHHGAFGQVMVEPAGAVPLTPETAEPETGGGSALVTGATGQPDFREHGLLFADAQYVINRHDPRDCVVPRPDEQGTAGGATSEDGPRACTRVPEDTEDQGYGGVNYRSEPFERRFESVEAQHLVFDSTVHGDPNTPVVGSTAGDSVRFRVACAGDKALAITFHLAGHQWQRFRGTDESPVIGVDGQLGPGTVMTLAPVGGAGGPHGHHGDYLYQETKQCRRLESGMWGVFRVHEDAAAAAEAPTPVQPLPDCADELALEKRPEFVVEGDIDFTGSGCHDTVVGVPGSDVGGGALYVFLDTSPVAVAELASADLQVFSETPGDGIGVVVDSRDRSPEGGDGADIVTETAAGRVAVPGGRELQDLVDRLQEDREPESSLAAFVRAAMPPGAWPVVPLSLVADPL